MVLLQQSRLCVIVLLILSLVHVASQALLSSSLDCTTACLGLSSCETPTTCAVVQSQIGCECHECSRPCEGSRRLLAAGNATLGCECIDTSCEVECAEFATSDIWESHDLKCLCEQCKCVAKEPTVEACERIARSVSSDAGIRHIGCATASNLVSRACGDMRVLTTLPKSVDCSDVKLAGVFSVEEEVVVSSYGRLTGGDLDAGGFETRIFRIASGARLDLNEVMLRNGITARLAGGGCVLIEKFGELFAKNVTFADCVASKTHGGAVAAWSFTYVELHGCAILRAAARILGGGIALAQNAALRIVASQVSDCLSLGGAGGGFSLLGSSRVTIVGTEVSRCHAESTGGALQLQGAYLNMSESRIENCSSTYAGGLRIDDATVFVASSRISGCVAHVAGAGLLVSAHILSLVTLRDTIIDRCSSYSGGAAIARQLGSTLVLAGRTVVEKCADVYNAPLVSFDSSLIVGFEASIRNCTSSNAGAVEMNGGQLEFGGVIASNFGHETGGILGTDAAALSIGPYARLLRNMCKKHGGAVQVRDNATLEVSGPGVRVVRNMALLGGAFYLDAADVAFVTGPDVIVAENWASMDGGAFFTAASRLVLQGGVLLRENHCSDNGGALALVDSQLFVSSRGHVWVEWAMDFTQASGDIEGSVAVIYDTVMRLPYDADYTTMSQHAELGSRVVQYSCLNCESSYFFDGYSYTSIGWNGGFAMAKILNRERSERRVEVAESQHASNVAFSCASIDGVVKLVGNGAGGSGGAVWFSGASRGFIRGAEVTSNSCLESGSGFFVGILDSLRATNTTFHGNVGEGSVFVSTLAKVELETIVAHANVGGFLVVDTARAVNLKTVDVFDNRALTGAGLRIIKTANVSVRASAFWRNAADGDGGAITLIDSDVVFSNTNFDMNSAGASGGAIASFGKSTLHFQQEDCNLVDFVTDFTRTAASCSSVFFETAAQSTLTCDFYPLPCSELTYFGSCDGCGCYGGHINDASGIERGVVLEPPTLASVYAITPRASAVHVKSVCLSEGQYSARAIDKLNAAWGYGGTFTVVVKPNRGPLAIYHAGPIASNGSIAPVGFQLRADDASCKAYSNSAGKGGGFAFWDVQEPSWDGLVDKGGNMAAYGAVRATPAMALRLMSTPAIITSGARIVDPTLRVAVSDAYNQVVASATSTASVRTNATVANVFVANGFASFANGSASFPSLIIIGPPGRSIDLNVESPLATLAQGADVVHIQVEVRACFPYEKEMSDTCVSCPAGSYLFRDKPTDEGYCVDCPVGALCASSGSALSTLRTKSGWWRATATATKLYKCLPANACPASSPTAPSILYGSPGSCRKGHSGARCGACVRGYFNLHRGPCRRCQGGDRVFAIVFYCAFSGVMIALLTYLLIFDSGVRFGMRLHDARMAIAGHNGLVSLAVHRQGRDQTDDDSDIRAPVVSFLIKVRALHEYILLRTQLRRQGRCGLFSRLFQDFHRCWIMSSSLPYTWGSSTWHMPRASAFSISSRHDACC